MITFRFATLSDCDLLYAWANDEETRKHSFQSQAIPYEDHVAWFTKKVSEVQTKIFIFSENEQNIGVVRIENKNNEYVISISIDKLFRGKKLAAQMIRIASDYYFEQISCNAIYAFVKKDNLASYRSFVSAGFTLDTELLIEHTESCKLIKTQTAHE